MRWGAFSLVMVCAGCAFDGASTHGSTSAGATAVGSSGTGGHFSYTSSSSNSSSSSGTTTGGSSSSSSGASSTSSSSSGSTSGSSTGTTGIVDEDQDGLDDAWETQVASDYLPFVSLSTSEDCGTPSGFAVRVFPHPQDPSRPPRYLEIRYDHLYQVDCGTAGHPGDDENFAITVDTTLPAPEGIMVIAAISHRNTACEHDSWCVQQSWSSSPCSGYATCDVGSNGFPVVYVSKDKHGDYATTNGCTFGCDFGSCELNPTPDRPLIVNVGEPGHPLVNDLTTQGFINAANGWTDTTLYDYDPWGSQTFGGAGTVSADLTDAALDTPICQ